MSRPRNRMRPVMVIGSLAAYGQAGRPYTTEPLETERARIAAALLST